MNPQVIDNDEDRDGKLSRLAELINDQNFLTLPPEKQEGVRNQVRLIQSRGELPKEKVGACIYTDEQMKVIDEKAVAETSLNRLYHRINDGTFFNLAPSEQIELYSKIHLTQSISEMLGEKIKSFLPPILVLAAINTN